MTTLYYNKPNFKSPNTRIQNNKAKARTEDQSCAPDFATIYLYN